MNFKKAATIVAAAGALTALAIPAMAETSLYGSARLATFYNIVDTRTGATGSTSDKNADFEEALHANSRLGVNFVNGTQTAKIEFGVGGGFSARHAYGAQKFDFGTVLVGQTENPYYFYTASVAKTDNVNNNYGSLWDTRQPQIKLTLNNGVYVAAIQPTAAAATTENYLPKLNVGYDGKVGNFAYGAGVVGQTYTVTATDKNLTSLLGYFHGTLKADAATLAFNFGIGQNTGNMGFTSANATATNVYTGGKDTISAEGFVQGSYQLNPTMKLNAGVGYAMDDNDSFAKTDNRMALFVNTNVTLAKGFSVTPEIAYFDQLDQTTGAKGNKEYLVGAKWQMDF